MTTFGWRQTSSPIWQSRPTWLPPISTERAPILTPAPITQCGPMRRWDRSRGVRVDHSARMDARCVFLRREKERQYSRHGHACIRYTNQDFIRGCEFGAHKNSSSRALFGCGKVCLFLGKVRSPVFALSAGAKPVNRTEPSPTTSPWSWSAI